jgi:hypothetical protein
MFWRRTTSSPDSRFDAIDEKLKLLTEINAKLDTLIRQFSQQPQKIQVPTPQPTAPDPHRTPPMPQPTADTLSNEQLSEEPTVYEDGRWPAYYRNLTYAKKMLYDDLKRSSYTERYARYAAGFR